MHSSYMGYVSSGIGTASGILDSVGIGSGILDYAVSLVFDTIGWSWFFPVYDMITEVAIDEERNVNKARYTQRIQRKNT